MPALPTLAISDGTTTISLIDARNGFVLRDWMPARPLMNQTRRNSIFTGGSAVRMYTYGDVIDTFTVAARNVEQDTLIANCQELDRLLTKAVDYWASNWTTTPVWIEAKGPNETNRRYAIIKSYQVGGEGNPYAQPFFGVLCLAGHSEMTIAIEHGIWQDVRPAQVVRPAALVGTSTPMSAQQLYNGITYGRSNLLCDLSSYQNKGEHYVANKSNMANITHVYRYDASLVAYSANLIGAALPVALFPAVPATGDMLFIGCATAVANSGPFNNVIFDYDVPAVYTAPASVAFEYYNGAAWAAIPIFWDDTTSGLPNTPFSNAAPYTVSGFHFTPPANWTAVAANAVVAYWIRLNITVGGGGAIAPVPNQRNRNIYTCTWPRVDIAAADVGGDMPALAQLRLRCRSDGHASGFEQHANRVLVGLRSQSRGADFNAYLNLADEQNHASVTVTNMSVDCTFVTDTEAPSGRAVQYSVAGVSALQGQVFVTMTTALATMYKGHFRAFLRYKRTAGGSSDILCRLSTYAGMPTVYTATQTMAVSSHWSYMDFGIINLGDFVEVIPNLGLMIYLQNTVAAARVVTLYDLVLVPCDEWFGDIQEAVPADYELASDWLYLFIDSIRDPKRNLAAKVYGLTPSLTLGDAKYTDYVPYAAGSIILQANVDQRLWFFFMNSHGGTTLPRYAPPEIACSLTLWRAQRYQSMRGAR